MLFAHEAWERKISPLGLLYQGENIKYYPFFEVSNNADLFHIDIQEKGRKKRWLRYVVADIFDVLPFLRMKNVREVQISLQVSKPNEEGRSYDILPVIEIVDARDEMQQQAFIYRCSNEEIFVRSIFTTSEDHLTEKQTIYLRSCYSD